MGRGRRPPRGIRGGSQGVGREGVWKRQAKPEGEQVLALDAATGVAIISQLFKNPKNISPERRSDWAD